MDKHHNEGAHVKQVLRRISSAKTRRDQAQVDLIEAIQEARAEKLTLREIADVAGMTHETVRKYGVPKKAPAAKRSRTKARTATPA